MAASALEATAKDWAGYLEVEPPPEPGVFEVGLVMAGMISAGAYTDGVIDILIEALVASPMHQKQPASASSGPLNAIGPGVARRNIGNTLPSGSRPLDEKCSQAFTLS